LIKVNKTLDFTGQVCYSVYVGEGIGFSLTNNEACERARRKKKMKNQTTEELAKTYYQAMMEAFEAGNHEEVLSLFSELGNQSQEAVIAANETIDENGERPFSRMVVESGLAATAWMGKRLTTTETYHVVDGEDFITTTHTWENHSETTTVPVSECEYVRQYNDCLITQSELYNKLESLKKGNN
jgi:hypothetical protein